MSFSHNSWQRFLIALALLLVLALCTQASPSIAKEIQNPVEFRNQFQDITPVGMEILRTQEPLQIAFSHATRTPRPTSTPPAIPPPADPASTNLMILLAATIVSVILFGIWINRSRAV